MNNEINELFKNPDLDPRSVESLINALSSNSLQGFDYLKFKKSLLALKDMGMSEDLAFKSTYTTISSLGVNKDKLVNTAKHYLDVLSRERNQFESALKNQLHQRVDAKYNEAEVLTERIKEYENKIEELKAQIEVMRKQVSDANAQIESSKEKIELTKTKFESTFEYFTQVIENDLQLINQYL